MGRAAREHGLAAVVFDVDGTMAETERHGHRVAFNRAFEELGLPDRWDEDLYGELLRVTGGERRLRTYFEGHKGIAPGSAAGLAAAVHHAKTRIFVELVTSGGLPPRPGLLRLLDDLARRGVGLAVATTGSRTWVIPLLDRLLAGTHAARFDVVVTGDDVAHRKPDPEAFDLAVRRLGCGRARAVAVEDSSNGVLAARAAGLACVAVPGDYGTSDEVARADLVVDGFGLPTRPSMLLYNPHRLAWRGMLDIGVLEAVRRVVNPGNGDEPPLARPARPGLASARHPGAVRRSRQ